MAGKIAKIGKRGMRSIKTAKLHQLMRFDIGHELRPGSTPIRMAGGKVGLDHPLTEWLMYHGGHVQISGAVGQRGNILPCCCRRYPVNHR